MSEYFAEAFASVFVTEPPLALALNQMYGGHMTMVSVCEADVVAVLQNLGVSSTVGLDEVHVTLLKYCASEVAKALVKNFQKSLRYSILPEL